MMILWVFVFVGCVYIGSAPLFIFLGKMRDIDDYINSTHHLLPTELRKSFKNIHSSVNWVFSIGIVLYIMIVLLVSVFCLYQALL